MVIVKMLNNGLKYEKNSKKLNMYYFHILMLLVMCVVFFFGILFCKSKTNLYHTYCKHFLGSDMSDISWFVLY